MYDDKTVPKLSELKIKVTINTTNLKIQKMTQTYDVSSST